MPKQKRWSLKRDLDYADKHLDAAYQFIVKVGGEFKDIHPDMTGQLVQIAAAIDLVRQATQKFRDSF